MTCIEPAFGAAGFGSRAQRAGAHVLLRLFSMTDQRPPLRRRLRNIVLRWSILLIVLGFFFWSTGCMERLFYYPQRGPTPLSFAPPGTEAVDFNSADGTKLHGWFIPANAAAAIEQRREHPTILHVHGNAGNIVSHAWFTEHLPRAGFNVFIFDFRGYGQSEGSATRREGLIADTHAAIDHLLSRADVDPKRLGVYGQSLGGAIALNVMADRSEIRAAVLESAFTSWREVAASALGGDPPLFLGSWMAAVCIRDTHRPIDAMARIDRPSLLLHGDADSIVPVSHARRLADASAGQARLVVLTGGAHNSLRDSHPEVDRLMIDFFATHLGEAE